MTHHDVRRHIALVAHENKRCRTSSLPAVLPQRSSGDGNGALRSVCICISMRDS
jgi:hypothetical protein